MVFMAAEAYMGAIDLESSIKDISLSILQQLDHVLNLWNLDSFKNAKFKM